MSQKNLVRKLRRSIKSHVQFENLRNHPTFNDSSALSQSLSCAKMVNFAYAIVIVIFWVASELRPSHIGVQRDITFKDTFV